MLFNATLETLDDGSYLARCDDPMVMARGRSAANALEQLRLEIRYRIELCPCSSVDDHYVQLHLQG